jgi:glutamate-1-semialdehyde 2,1-aminomutase
MGQPMSTLAVVQARMGSMRLPGKVLEKVGDSTLIELLLRRLTTATQIDDIVVAMPISAINDELEAVVTSAGYRVFRGSEEDVLDRYHQAALVTRPDVVVRITGDCPLVDGDLVDAIVTAFCQQDVDYLSNTISPTFPDGMDIEVFTFNALHAAAENAHDPFDREHVTPFLKTSSRIRRSSFVWPEDLSGLRWTVDDPADLEIVRRIVKHFSPRTDFTWLDVLEYVRSDDLPKELVAMQDKRDAGATLSSGHKLWKRAKTVIPGGNMLLSKRPEMFVPEFWPPYFDSTSGCTVTDIDGRDYIDMSLMGIGTNTLGYSHPVVDEAVRKVVNKGNLSTLNCPEEVLLAERLIELHPWADMAKFARSGGEANAIAIRIARAASGRDGVAICGYHGWHDWYLAANLGSGDTLAGHLLPGLNPLGVPRDLAGSVHAFKHGDLETLTNLMETQDIGVIKMEVSRNVAPDGEYLREIRRLADKHDAVLIFDECTSGFRQTFGGLHLQFDVAPDMATFGKALGNGYAITAVIGTAAVMDAAQSTFISSTFWTERIGPAAALATLDVMEKTRSWELITEIGRRIIDGWHGLADDTGLIITSTGLPALATFSFDGVNTLAYKTLMAQEMLKRGYLAGPGAYACLAHTEDVISRYFDELRPVFALIKECDEGRDLHSVLEWPVCHSGFARLN